MPRVSSKRQITLPIDQCRELNIEPGDEVETFVYKGQMTIVKKERGCAAGRLKRIDPSSISDADSRQGAINKRAKRSAGRRKRRPARKRRRGR